MHTLQQWHEVVKHKDSALLDTILAEDVTFYSPVVWTPQKGKDITTLYLTAAMHVLGENNFRYTKEVAQGSHICLEFEATVEDITINGIDIISLDAEGKIKEFKVMVRPYKAMITLKDLMAKAMGM